MSKEYTILRDFRYTSPGADNLPTMGQAYNLNLNRLRSWLPNGILNGGEVTYYDSTTVSFVTVLYHYNANQFIIASNTFVVGSTNGTYYLYYDSTGVGITMATSLTEARNNGVPISRIIISGGVLDSTDIDDIREIIPNMPQDLSDLKNFAVGQYSTDMTSSSTWVVTHNLDTVDISSIICFNTSDIQIIPNSITINDKDQITIDWGGTSVAGSVKVER